MFIPHSPTEKWVQKLTLKYEALLRDPNSNLLGQTTLNKIDIAKQQKQVLASDHSSR
jgi:hypothetical protein